MKRYLSAIGLSLLAVACNPVKQKDTNSLVPAQRFTREIKLGEDKEEMHGLVKRIYNIDHSVFIDLDFIEISYKNVDERVIKNNNPMIRTYEVDTSTLIYSNDCKTLKSFELLEPAHANLLDSSIIVVGSSKDGKMTSINFGCYD